MLPLLPALILLLLQGPANIERLAHDGHFQAALTAIKRQMPAEQHTRSADEAVLASLFARTSDTQLSQALFYLLSITEPEPVRPQVVAKIEDGPRRPIPPSLGCVQDGFNTSQRSRDGPSIA